jgi:NAD(P)H-hydrate epimerase
MKSIPTLCREEVRRVDQRAIEQFGMPGAVLMENAGRGCVDTLLKLGVNGPVIICCGKGNNAGDGLVMARHLELHGVATRLLFWSHPDQLQGDAGINYQIARHAELPVHVLSDDPQQQQLDELLDGAEWIIDAMLGTGARGAPREPFSRVIIQLNQRGCRKLSLDLPSGLDCDTGAVSSPTFRADHTCTFVAAKPGLVLESSAPYVGTLHVIDIGVPKKLLREFGLI